MLEYARRGKSPDSSPKRFRRAERGQGTLTNRRELVVTRDLAVIVAQGENEHVEFKRSLPGQTIDARR
jgi:hypothetical protein